MTPSNLLDWLPLSSLGVGLLGLLFGSVALSVIVAITAHWPQRIPGPLTPQERAKVGKGVMRRVGFGLLVPALGLLALLLLLLALLPIRRPETLVLMSRSRGSAGPWLDKCESEAGVGTQSFNDPTTHAVRDLSPVVDEVLDGYIDAPHLWDLDVPSNRETLRGRVLAAFEVVEAPRVAHAGEAKPFGSVEHRKIDRRLIETVELSLLTLAIDRYNTHGIRIRSDRSYDSVRTWRLAQQMMAAKRREFLLCSEGELRPTDPLRISQLTAARIEQNERVMFWALVEGQFSDDAAGKDLALDISLVTNDGDASRLELLATVARDDLAGRIVRCPSKSCTLDLTVAQRESLSLLVAKSHGRRGDPWLRLSALRVRGSSDVWTPISLAEATRARDLAIASTEPWRSFFAALALPPFKQFRSKLAARGQLVPRIVDPGATGADAVLLLEPHGVVIARNEEDARHVAGKFLTTPPAATVRGRDWRGQRIDRGPSDAFSWRDLPVRSTLIAPEGGRELVTTTWTDREDLSTRDRVEVPLILYVEEPRAVVIGIAQASGLLDPKDPRHEPTLALALVDTVTDSIEMIHHGSGGLLAGDTLDAGTSSRGLAEPLVRSADQDKLLDVSMWDHDLALALALALYLLAIAMQIRRP